MNEYLSVFDALDGIEADPQVDGLAQLEHFVQFDPERGGAPDKVNNEMKGGEDEH